MQSGKWETQKNVCVEGCCESEVTTVFIIKSKACHIVGYKDMKCTAFFAFGLAQNIGLQCSGRLKAVLSKPNYRIKVALSFYSVF